MGSSERFNDVRYLEVLKTYEKREGEPFEWVYTPKQIEVVDVSLDADWGEKMRGKSLLRLYYDPDFSSNEKILLRVKKGMPSVVELIVDSDFQQLVDDLNDAGLPPLEHFDPEIIRKRKSTKVVDWSVLKTRQMQRSAADLTNRWKVSKWAVGAVYSIARRTAAKFWDVETAEKVISAVLRTTETDSISRNEHQLPDPIVSGVMLNTKKVPLDDSVHSLTRVWKLEKRDKRHSDKQEENLKQLFDKHQIKEIITNAKKTMWVHGWASDVRVHDERLRLENLVKREGRINTLVYGYGVKGGALSSNALLVPCFGKDRCFQPYEHGRHLALGEADDRGFTFYEYVNGRVMQKYFDYTKAQETDVEKMHVNMVEAIQLFTPVDYGEQLAFYCHRMFGWEHEIEVMGHSKGGVGGGLWFPLKVFQNDKYRKQDGGIPDIRSVMMATAYPAEANRFISPILEFGVGVLAALPPWLRPLGAPFAYIINQALIPQAHHQKKTIHTDVAIANPRTVLETMLGLKWQREILPDEMRLVLDNIRSMVVVTNPGDLVVNEEISNTTLNVLVLRAMRFLGNPFQGVLPLFFSEKWATEKNRGTHYVASQSGRVSMEPSVGGGVEILQSPLISVSAMFDQFSAQMLPRFQFLYASMLHDYHFDENRKTARSTTKAQYVNALVDKLGDVLPDHKEMGSEVIGGFKQTLGRMLDYHRMLYIPKEMTV